MKIKSEPWRRGGGGSHPQCLLAVLFLNACRLFVVLSLHAAFRFFQLSLKSRWLLAPSQGDSALSLKHLQGSGKEGRPGQLRSAKHIVVRAA